MTSRIFAIACAVLLVGGMTACQEEGAMEKAGKKLDEAAEELEEGTEEAKKKLAE